MSTNQGQQPVAATTTPSSAYSLNVLKKLAIWGLFFFVLYVTRDFFFLAFMTFLFSYMALALADSLSRKLKLSPENPRSRRLLILGIFIFIPLILFVVGALIMPHLIAQGQHLIAWVSQTNPEAEAARLVERYVGHSEFEHAYGGSQDPRYLKAFEEYRKTGQRFVTEYDNFPQQASWIEGGFSRQYDDVVRARLQSQLLNEGVSSKDFEIWFLNTKLPAVKTEQMQGTFGKNNASTPLETFLRSAATTEPAAMLRQIRHASILQTPLQQEWIKDTIDKTLAQVKDTSKYQEQFHAYYENQLKIKQSKVPYTFEQYIKLQKARSHGQAAFSAVMAKIKPVTGEQTEEQLKQDFEAFKKHELFQAWWSTSSPAKFIRHELDFNASGSLSTHLEGMATSLLNIPLDLSTALLLSFLICIDFPALRRASQRLRTTWLRDVYDELIPALTRLGQLIGKAMYAQGLVALCNAVMLFLFMEFLGIEHAVLLAFVVFVVCLVPTLGTVIAWVLIAIIAMVQPGGGLILALKASGAVAIVVILETFVFSPRILGRLMELHPVLIIALLPVAHYFFGIWGLILAVPVAVYIINEVILGHSEQDSPGTADAA
ncbi:MAG TPA: AI-2E family transporter [Gemmatales bacterium]|nr:AI-2E family transporter [Gemmatales bacterium]